METASSFNQPRIKGENAQITTGGVERALPREEARLGPLSRCRARAVGAIRTLQTAHATYCRPKMRMPLTRRLLAFVTISCNTRESDSAPNLQLAPLFPPLQLIPPMRLQISGARMPGRSGGRLGFGALAERAVPRKNLGKAAPTAPSISRPTTTRCGGVCPRRRGAAGCSGGNRSRFAGTLQAHHEARTSPARHYDNAADRPHGHCSLAARKRSTVAIALDY